MDRGAGSLDLLQALAQIRCKLVGRLLRVAQEHLRVLLEEDRVLKVGVAAGHGALAEDDLLGPPHLDHRHAPDRAALDLLRGGVGDVVRADHEHDVDLLHLGVDLVHLEDPLVRHAGLGKEHVHLAWHAAGHRVDAELDGDAGLAARGGDLADAALRARDGHAVSWDNQHLLGAGHELRRVRHACLHVDLRGLVAGLLRWCRDVHAAEDDVEDVTVHGVAHDLRQDRSAAADEGADDREHRALQQEALCDQGPAGVGVQDRDAHRHVTAAHAGHEVVAHDTGDGSQDQEVRDAQVALALGAEQGADDDAGGQHAEVQDVLARQVQGLGAEVAVQLAEGDNGARQRDGTDDVAEDGRDVLHVGPGHRVLVEGADRGARRGGAHQRVEGRDSLRQGHGAHLHTDDKANAAADGHQDQGDGEHGRAERHAAGGDRAEDANHAELAARIGRGHRGQAADGRHAEERGDGADRADQLRVRQCREAEDEAGDKHEHGVVGHAGPAEEIQHALRDHEATDDVDGGDDDGRRGEALRGRGLGVREEQQATDGGHA
mmetsp:Transcript_49740/g.67781  ORF Transcript_49740/g.67781 Transcript_49740/m.67781 type:complete len:547 (-) Transcript_49740:1504-3144(-)